jgi:hypothetical protein
MLELIGLLLVVLVLFYLYKNKNKNNKNTDTAQVKEEIKEISKAQEGSEILIKLEEHIAINGSLSDVPKNKVTELFTLLYETIFKINEEFPSATPTYEINQMAKEHLPNKINAYINLSQSDKTTRQDAFIEDIDKLITYVISAKEIIEKNNLSKDERESMLIEIKY